MCHLTETILQRAIRVQYTSKKIIIWRDADVKNSIFVSRWVMEKVKNGTVLDEGLFTFLSFLGKGFVTLESP